MIAARRNMQDAEALSYAAFKQTGINLNTRFKVHVIPNNGQQIKQTTLNCRNPSRKLWKPSSNFGEPLRLERRVHDDAAAFAQCSAE
jgi:hypothetical protein